MSDRVWRGLAAAGFACLYDLESVPRHVQVQVYMGLPASLHIAWSPAQVATRRAWSYTPAERLEAGTR